MNILLNIRREEIEAALESWIAENLPGLLERVAQRRIDERIGMLSLEEAMGRLQCRNPRQLADFCREQSIPILHFGAKKRFIRVADIELAQARAARRMAAESGTTIGRALTTL